MQRVARGLATGDFDNDGRIDVLIVMEKMPLAFFPTEERSRRDPRGSRTGTL